MTTGWMNLSPPIARTNININQSSVVRKFYLLHVGLHTIVPCQAHRNVQLGLNVLPDLVTSLEDIARRGTNNHLHTLAGAQKHNDLGARRWDSNKVGNMLDGSHSMLASLPQNESKRLRPRYVATCPVCGYSKKGG